MSLFVLDTTGDKSLHSLNDLSVSRAQDTKCKLLDVAQSRPPEEQNESDDNDEDDEDEDFFGLPPPSVDVSEIIASTLATTISRKQTRVDDQMTELSERVDVAAEKAEENKHSRRTHTRITHLDYSDFNPLTGKLDDERLVQTDTAKVMAKSKLTPGSEQLKGLPSLTKKQQRLRNRFERSKTKGAGWFNLPATEITEEIANDLKILQMRSVLDPKHFYKKNDLKVLPKYFQIGTVQHSPLDYYNERDTRRNKKRSLVDELLADAEAQKYTKRKYKEIVARTNKYTHRKAMKKMKKLKKKK